MALTLFDVRPGQSKSPSENGDIALKILRTNLAAAKANIAILQKEESLQTQERIQQLKRQKARLELTQIQLRQCEAEMNCSSSELQYKPPNSYNLGDCP